MTQDTIRIRRWTRREYDRMLGPNETVSPLAAPAARILVADLLP